MTTIATTLLEKATKERRGTHAQGPLHAAFVLSINTTAGLAAACLLLQMYRRDVHNGLMLPPQPQPPPQQQQQQPPEQLQQQLEVPVAREPLLLFPLLQQHRARQGFPFPKDFSSSPAAAPGAASGLPAAATGAGSAGTPCGAGSQWRWTLGRNDRKKVAVTALCLQGEVPLEMQQVRNSLLLLALLLLVIHLLLVLLFPYLLICPFFCICRHETLVKGLRV